MLYLTKNIKPDFKDARGVIAKILDDGKTKIRSILYITGKRGTVRANHYHKQDTHYVYMLSGKMTYYEKAIAGKKVEKAILKKGDMIFSPPKRIHAFKFLENTEWIVLSTMSRSQEHYESDTVRVKFIER
ncbi:MAG: cupin domain-containing protein [Patescibacteria group bacterium]